MEGSKIDILRIDSRFSKLCLKFLNISFTKSSERIFVVPSQMGKT